jgi:hypothetical protein
MRKPFLLLAVLALFGGAAACSRADGITATGRTLSAPAHDETATGGSSGPPATQGDTTTRGGGGTLGSGG